MIDWHQVALVFPGQGSQVVGMSQSLAAHYPAARTVLDEADQILGMPFSRLMIEGPGDVLDDTLNTQPALYIAGVAAYRALTARFGGDDTAIWPQVMAGHSLGELTALTCAGSLPFEYGLPLVKERARLMKYAGEIAPGAMAALLGLDVDVARAICEEASSQSGQPLVVANDNCPGQVVISGDAGTLELALPLAKARGAKRAIRLAVSVAAHSPLMQPAQSEFRMALQQVELQVPRCAVIGNTTATPLTTSAHITEELSRQLTGTVRWTESVQAIRALGVTHCLELGSKDVLCGLIRRIDPALTATPIHTAEGMEQWVTIFNA